MTTGGSVPPPAWGLASLKSRQTPFVGSATARTAGTCWESSLEPPGEADFGIYQTVHRVSVCLCGLLVRCLLLTSSHIAARYKFVTTKSGQCKRNCAPNFLFYQTSQAEFKGGNAEHDNFISSSYPALCSVSRAELFVVTHLPVMFRVASALPFLPSLWIEGSF